MIYDNRVLFSSAQSIVGSAGTGINSTNVIDTGSVSRDLGNGDDILLLVECTTSIVAAGSGTLTIALVSSASSSLTTPTTHASVSIPTAASASGVCVAGQQMWCIAFPVQGQTYLEYLGIIYTPVSQNISAGAVNAFLCTDPHGLAAYPTVSGLV